VEMPRIWAPGRVPCLDLETWDVRCWHGVTYDPSCSGDMTDDGGQTVPLRRRRPHLRGGGDAGCGVHNHDRLSLRRRWHTRGQGHHHRVELRPGAQRLQDHQRLRPRPLGEQASEMGVATPRPAPPRPQPWSGSTPTSGPTANCWIPKRPGFYSCGTASSGVWPVGDGNTWGADSVGYTPEQVAFYRANKRAPCGFTAHQQMSMTCPDGAHHNYGQLNTLRANITATTVSSARAGQSQRRRIK